MLTNVKNPVVAPFAEFLAVASTSEVKNHYSLLLSNHLTGRSASLQISGSQPSNEDHLRNEFEVQVAVVLRFGFTNFEDFQEILATEDMTLPILEELEEYREISLKSSTLLYIFGDVQRLEDIMDLQLA